MKNATSRWYPDAGSPRQRIERASARLLLRREQSAVHVRACTAALRRPAVLPLVALAAVGFGFVVGRMRRGRAAPTAIPTSAAAPSLMVLALNAIALASAVMAFMTIDRNPRPGV